MSKKLLHVIAKSRLLAGGPRFTFAATFLRLNLERDESRECRRAPTFMAPSAERLRDVGRFAVPAGTAAGLGVLASYLFALNVLDLPLTSARTVATTVLVGVGLYFVVVLESTSRRREAAVGALCLVLVGAYALVLLLPAGRSFFELAAPGIGILLTAAAGIVLAAAGLWLVDERFVPTPASPDPTPNP